MFGMLAILHAAKKHSVELNPRLIEGGEKRILLNQREQKISSTWTSKNICVHVDRHIFMLKERNQQKPSLYPPELYMRGPLCGTERR